MWFNVEDTIHKSAYRIIQVRKGTVENRESVQPHTHGAMAELGIGRRLQPAEPEFESPSPLLMHIPKLSDTIRNMKCTTCKLEKREEEFGWRNKANGVRHNYCLECKQKYNKAWYQRHKAEQILRVARNNEKYTETARLHATNAKDVPCTDCGKRFPPEAMDFDHVTGEKLENVSTLARRSNVKKLREEIAKCEVVCACCHRIRTTSRLRLKDKAVAS